MRIRFVLGPAGSGKTFRCLAEVRQALAASLEGAPLLLLAPKQTTYELERQLLAPASMAGYSRLHIISFERLAWFVFDQLGRSAPEMLDDEGRLMVLRGLLARKRDDLKLFRASARLTGFAQQLSGALRELQRNQLTPESLNQLATQVEDVEGLAYKLQDLATLLQDYLNWLKAHHLQDADCLLAGATEALLNTPPSEAAVPRTNNGRIPGRPRRASRVPSPEAGQSFLPLGQVGAAAPATLNPQASTLRIEQLWVDGFGELCPQELELLAALLPHCGEATLTFCLERVPAKKASWLSNWSVVSKSFEECKRRLGALPGAEIVVETLSRDPQQSRFSSSPALRHLEQSWSAPQPYILKPKSAPSAPAASSQSELPLRLVACANPEAEATLAAHEILRHVRAGGRYREVAVLVRRLESYHEPLQRVLARYQIPHFLDRRESVSHHPLAELTRSALRTVAAQWQHDDWFAALKTGLVPAEEVEIDRLENEALARGWRGAIWQTPIGLPKDEELTHWLASMHERLLPPFQRLALALAARKNKPTGLQLAAALREFWSALKIEQRLEEWAATEASSSALRMPTSVHATVWEQMNAWLANVELAFPSEPLSVREWLPILEAGLSSLSVGVIPPALDQVLVGSIDRSRNPAIRLALVLGLNEGLFPAPPETNVLLTEVDRSELEKRNVSLGDTARQQLARERYHAYIACTRARERLVLTCALHDANGSPLNPSPFLSQVRQLFPSLKLEAMPANSDWRDSEHVSELIVPLLKLSRPAAAPRGRQDRTPGQALLSESLAAFPNLSAALERLRQFQNPKLDECLAPELAARLYGPVLRTSVSRMEQFAACPFKFFVHSGLRAEERQLFELDVKEQGTFQHDVLALFHLQLRRENKRWRDITPNQARALVAQVAEGLVASYREGLLQASEQTRFMARVLIESLQDFVETLVGWMQSQYQFDPVAVELPFGEGEDSPAWSVPVGKGQRLELYGRIDRIDLCRTSDGDQALCAVIDYKSSQKQLDPILLEHGLQLQLLTYLNVLRHWPDPQAAFGVGQLIPAGVFYVNLRGKYDREQNRLDALADTSQARKLAYRHAGRFDAQALPWLDARPDAREGDQFKYRLTKDGQVYKNSREALDRTAFLALLDQIETNLKKMGQEIYAGQAKVAPYRKGSLTACDQCSYAAICRIDPWTHAYRVLKPRPAEGSAALES